MDINSIVFLIGIAMTIFFAAVIFQLVRAEGIPVLRTSFGRVPYRVIYKDEGENLPIIIGLHGFGIDERQMESLAGVKPGFPHIYVAPRGFYQLEDKSYGWFPIAFESNAPVIKVADLEAAIKHLHEVIDGLVYLMKANHRSVYLFGYSQGSGVALMYALAYPQNLKATIAFNGYLTPEMKLFAEKNQSLARMPILYGHGMKDTLISEQLAVETKVFMQTCHYPVTFKSYPVFHVISAAGRKDIEAFLNTMNNEELPQKA